MEMCASVRTVSFIADMVQQPALPFVCPKQGEESSNDQKTLLYIEPSQVPA